MKKKNCDILTLPKKSPLGHIQDRDLMTAMRLAERQGVF